MVPDNQDRYRYFLTVPRGVVSSRGDTRVLHSGGRNAGAMVIAKRNVRVFITLPRVLRRDVLRMAVRLGSDDPRVFSKIVDAALRFWLNEMDFTVKDRRKRS
jgi:hypothetical protein